MSSKKQLGFTFAGFILLLSLIFTLTMDFVKSTGVLFNQSFTYFQVTFGYKMTVLGSEIAIFKFSIMNFLIIVLMVLALSLVLLRAFSKKHKKNSNLSFIIVIVTLLFGVLSLFVIKFLAPGTENQDFSSLKLASAPILNVILSVLASTTVIASEMVIKD